MRFCFHGAFTRLFIVETQLELAVANSKCLFLPRKWARKIAQQISACTALNRRRGVNSTCYPGRHIFAPHYKYSFRSGGVCNSIMCHMVLSPCECKLNKQLPASLIKLKRLTRNVNPAAVKLMIVLQISHPRLFSARLNVQNTIKGPLA